VFENRMPRYEVLSEDAMAVLDAGWRRLVSELGVRFGDPEAREILRQAGQTIEDDIVHFDPDWVAEQVAKAPSEFELRAPNPARSVRVGGAHMMFCPTNSAPFVREGSQRREGTFADYEQMVKLTQVIPELDSTGYPIVECSDLPLETRHLDTQLMCHTHCDKVLPAAAFHEIGTIDAIGLARARFGEAAVDEHAYVWGVVNANSPLTWDDRMLGSLKHLARANQCVVTTPFILMGAMGPVSIPAAVAQQTAEALTGIALVQTIRPGCPCILGSFVSHTDMQSGSPGFGGPESSLGLLISGQVARRLKLPWRAGGGALTSSQVPDAQAAVEGFNTMACSFLAGANLQLHTLGWLESGLVTSYEKWMVDLEMLRILLDQFTPLEIDEASLAFDAHAEAGHGGHHFGTAHTLERFRECFYRPHLFSTENFDRWTRNGSLDAAARAPGRWKALVEAYEQPAIDDDALGRLNEYVERRKQELSA
jgi:trimethylamine---corrinoid protein Co-methyltransferase